MLYNINYAEIVDFDDIQDLTPADESDDYFVLFYNSVLELYDLTYEDLQPEITEEDGRYVAYAVEQEKRRFVPTQVEPLF